MAGAGDAPPARRALVRPIAREFGYPDCGSGRLLCLTPTGTADADHSATMTRFRISEEATDRTRRVCARGPDCPPLRTLRRSWIAYPKRAAR